MEFDKRLFVRVYRKSENTITNLRSLIEEDEHVTINTEKEMEKHKDFELYRTLNSPIRSKIQNQNGMTVLTETDLN